MRNRTPGEKQWTLSHRASAVTSCAITCATMAGLIAAAACSDGSGADADVAQDAGRAGAAGTSSGGASATHYPADKILRYDLEIDPTVWSAMLADPQCKGPGPCGNEYVEATLRFDGRTFPRVGVRFKGNSTLSHVASLAPTDTGHGRYSFKVKLDKYVKGQELDGLQTLNLNNEFLDPSMMREVLAYEMFRNANVIAPRTAYTELYLNGELYGLYVSVEEVESPFLKKNFQAGGGNLYKPDYGDLVFHGPSIADYSASVAMGADAAALQVTGEQACSKQNNETEADYADLLTFIAVLNNTADDALESEIGKVFDIDSFTSFLAVNTIVTALDFYGGGLPQNYYLYHEPSAGRFVYIPWDMNNAWGTFDCFLFTSEQVVAMPPDSTYCLNTPNAMKAGRSIGAADRPLLGRLLANRSIRGVYLQKVSQLLQSAFVPAALHSRIDALAAMIRPSLQNDPHRFYTMDEFDRSFTQQTKGAPGIKTFISQRTQALSQYFAGGCADAGSDCGAPAAPDGSTGCGTCATYHATAGRCVPACGQGCTCPATAPDGGAALVCDEQAGICHP
jgi:spore coat protein H